MKLMVKHQTSAEQLLGTVSLESLKIQLQRKINDNPDLNKKQRKRVLRELDFLIEYERLRRLKMAVHQWEREEQSHTLDLLKSRVEIVNKLRIARAKSDRLVAKMHSDTANLRLVMVEKLLALKKKHANSCQTNGAAKELENLRIRDEIARKKEEAFHANISRRTLNRARFIKMVETDFPDMADELIDHYDKQLFNAGVRL